MPATLSIDHASRMVTIEIAGTLEIGEMLAAIDGVVRAIEGRGRYAVLTDHRALDTPITPVQVSQVLAHLSAAGGSLVGARWAAVVSQPASYGMMRLLAARAEDLPMEVKAFWDRNEALAWLRGGPDAPGGAA
ncbi:MAG: STAS/SEC14 domain-containing protein [Gemmatimonadetes bacterium]|nr:STAS/SEC14 domain-containing protein [Gemmatimonadota bacterium]